MNRVRVSTTVDASRLQRCREHFEGRTSQLIDQALLVLAEQLQREHDQAALDRHPYEDDPDMAWEAPPGPDLPYDGDVPDEVRRLAAARRRAAAG